MPRFVELNPVLPCRDVAEAIHYYVDKLGFRLLFQDRAENPTYAGIGRDGLALHLQWHDPATFDTAVDKLALRFVIEDVDALFDEYKEKGVFHEETALRNTDWGTREFAFYDLNSNGLFFYQDLSE